MQRRSEVHAIESARPRVRIPALAVLAAVGVGCGGGGQDAVVPPAGPPSIARLAVEASASPTGLRIGESLVLTVRPLDGSGEPVESATEFVFFETSDPRVMVPATAASGIVPGARSVDGTFRAVGKGRASIRISYPCRASVPDCDPTSTTSVSISVRGRVSGLSLEPAESIALTVEQDRTLEITVVDTDGVPVEGEEADVAAVTSQDGIVAVESRDEDPDDGRLVLALRGLAVGATVLRISHPALPSPSDVPVEVVNPVAVLHVDPSSPTVEKDQSAVVSILAAGPDGTPVRGAERALTVVSLDPTRVVVTGTEDRVPDDGRLSAILDGVAEGTAIVEIAYPGLSAARVSVTVVAPSGLVPVSDNLPGAYSRRATLTNGAGACPGSPTTLGDPPGSAIRVTRSLIGGETIVGLLAGQDVYVDVYDSRTGAWAGASESSGDDGTTRKEHAGHWVIDARHGTPAYRGTLEILRIAPDGSNQCRSLYEIEYRKLS